MTRKEAEQWLAGVGEPECGMLAVPATGSDMIERKCETCELFCHSTGRCGVLNEPSTGLACYLVSRAALEAEVERLTKERDEESGYAKILSNAITYWQGKTLMAADERDAAIARDAEERAARAGLEEQLVEAERRRDELRAQVADLAAQYRTLSARLESELGGLRHSLAETGAELDECLKELGEARAAAKVAQAEVERMRDGIGEAAAVLEAAVVAPADVGALSTAIALTGDILRALLGDAKEGGAS